MAIKGGFSALGDGAIPNMGDGPILPITKRRTTGPKDIGKVAHVEHRPGRSSWIHFQSGGKLPIPEEHAGKFGPGDILRGNRITMGGEIPEHAPVEAPRPRGTHLVGSEPPPESRPTPPPKPKAPSKAPVIPFNKE